MAATRREPRPRSWAQARRLFARFAAERTDAHEAVLEATQLVHSHWNSVQVSKGDSC